MSTELPWLRVEGNRIVDTLGNDVVLKGVNIADPEHIYRERYTDSFPNRFHVMQDVIDGVNTLGCKVVRIPVIPEGENKFGFLCQKDTYFSRYLEPIVDYCVNLGIIRVRVKLNFGIEVE